MKISTAACLRLQILPTCLLLFCLNIIPPPISVQAQNKAHYVQIGAFFNLDLVKQTELKKVGGILQEPTKSGATRILVGAFTSKSAAQKALPKIKAIGYKDAFLTTRMPNPGVNEGSVSKPKVVSPPETTRSIEPSTPDETTTDEVKPTATAILDGIAKKMETAPPKTFKDTKPPTPSKTAKADVKSNATNTSSKPSPKAKAKPKPKPIAITALPSSAYSTMHFSSSKVEYLIDPKEDDRILLFGDLLVLDSSHLILDASIKMEQDMYGQATVFYSDNAGKTWHQAMRPDFGYMNNDIVFTDAMNGYLTRLWYIEGPGDYLLYRTTNGGKNWRLQDTIPKPSPLCVPIFLHFDNEKQGTVIHECDDFSTTGLFQYGTKNGGKTWQKSSDKSLESYAEFKKQASQNKQKGDNFAYALFDDSKWRMVEEIDGLAVQIWNKENKKWITQGRIPRYYKLVRGKLVQW